jgi:copper chaperone NosL
MTRVKRAVLVLAVCAGAAIACAGGASPAPLQPGTPCSQCRMTVLDARLAAQLVAPGEEPRFFDDVGCLVAYLSSHPANGASRAYVTDHQAGEWIEASRAVYGRDEALATPMSSHLFAHASSASRSSDTSVHAGRILTADEVFGAVGVPGGGHGR